MVRNPALDPIVGATKPPMTEVEFAAEVAPAPETMNVLVCDTAPENVLAAEKVCAAAKSAKVSLALLVFGIDSARAVEPELPDVMVSLTVVPSSTRLLVQTF